MFHCKIFKLWDFKSKMCQETFKNVLEETIVEMKSLADVQEQQDPPWLSKQRASLGET